MAAVAPAQQASRLEGDHVALNGSDVDAEGEDDVDMEYDDATKGHSSTKSALSETKKKSAQADESGSEEASDDDGSQASDEEASDVEMEGHEDGRVGPVKVPKGTDLDSDAESGEEEDHNTDDSSEASDASSESIAAEDWEDASTGEGEADATSRNNCIFCKQDEEHDPGDDFEENLACSVCGDNAHQQCARDANSLDAGSGVGIWRCPQCVSNSLAPEADQGDEHEESEHEALTRRLSTSSRLTRDLLPAPRGGSKPGSHSIFSTLIVEDDPLDGSRALRKRKSSEVTETQSKASSKRRKKSIDGASTASGASSLSEQGDEESERLVGEVSPSRRRAPAAPVSVSSKLHDHETPGRLARPRRQKAEAPRVRPLVRDSRTFRIAIRVDLSQIKDTLPKKSRRMTAPTSSQVRLLGSNASHFQSPFYPMHEREMDESKIKPYGGILDEAEADTSKTFPIHPDRVRFEEARQRAEEEWTVKTAASEIEQETKGRASQKISGPPSKIKCINFGGFEIDTWYAAPYPEEYSRNRVLYICEFCLKYMPSDYVAWRHKLKCPAKHPPGDEIYRHASVSIFEVDGRKNPVYCQNLCLLAKLFLGSKTLYYDVEPFLFYIMTEYDDLGYHFVGYFSKEKRPSSMNNVSCILTLPIHQRKGYGNLLIDFSYLLTRVEHKTGSPEKPLSDMGLVSYRNYWRLQLAYKLIKWDTPLSIAKLSELTGMTADDIIAALEALRALVRDPITKTYALRLDRGFLKETIEKWEAKQYVKLNEDALIWTPYVMGQYNLNSYDRGGISTVAPREDEEEAAAPEEGVQQQQEHSGESLSHLQANGTAIGKPNPTIDAANIDPVLTAHVNNANATLEAPTSPPKTNGVHPASPLKPTSQTAEIPPSRYEIFPPLPKDQMPRRKNGRGGYRPRKYTSGGAPAPRGRPRNDATTPRPNGISPRHKTTPTSRKTRSALGQEIETIDPDDDDEKQEGESEEITLRTKGKGKAIANMKLKVRSGTPSEAPRSSRHASRRNSAKNSQEGQPEDDEEIEEDDEDEEEEEDEEDADEKGSEESSSGSDEDSEGDAEGEPEPEVELEEGENDDDFQPEDDADADEDAVEEDEASAVSSAVEDEDGEDSEDDAEAEPDPEAESEEDAEGESDPDAAGEEVEMIDT